MELGVSRLLWGWCNTENLRIFETFGWLAGQWACSFMFDCVVGIWVLAGSCLRELGFLSLLLRVFACVSGLLGFGFPRHLVPWVSWFS